MAPRKAKTAEIKGFAPGAPLAPHFAPATPAREIDLGQTLQSAPAVGSPEPFALAPPGRLQPRVQAFEVLANEDSEWPDPDELDDGADVVDDVSPSADEARFDDDTPGDGDLSDSDLEPGDLDGSDLEDADFDDSDFEERDFADAFDEPEDEPEFDFDWNDDDL